MFDDDYEDFIDDEDNKVLFFDDNITPSHLTDDEWNKELDEDDD